MSNKDRFFFESAECYLKSDLVLFNKNAQLTFDEIGTGNINHIYRVADKESGNSVIIKLAESEAIISSDLVIDTLRGKKESEMLNFYNRLLPGSAPEVYGYNSKLHIIVMGDMKNYDILQDDIKNISKYGFFPMHISDFLSQTLFFTSDFYLNHKEKKIYQKKFINPDLCDITERLVFSEPYLKNDNDYISEGNEVFVEKNVWQNTKLLNGIAELKYKFINEAQALIHGDLHFGSIFVSDKKAVVFDPEFSFYGPMGYDIGNIIAHFIIEYCLLYAEYSEITPLMCALKSQLTETVKLTFEKLCNLIEEKTSDRILLSSEFAENFIRDVFQDSLGYAGAECIRRAVGIAKHKKIKDVSPKIRTEAEIKIISAGIALVIDRNGISDYNGFEKYINVLLR